MDTRLKVTVGQVAQDFTLKSRAYRKNIAKNGLIGEKDTFQFRCD
jgi:hypothetical protein